MFEMEYQVQMDKLITAFVLDHRFPSHTIYDMVNYPRYDLPPNVINIAWLVLNFDVVSINWLGKWIGYKIFHYYFHYAQVRI